MSTRPPVFTWNEDLHFGPPSEMIDVQKFLDEAARLERSGLWPWLDFDSQGVTKDDALDKLSGWKLWREASEDMKASVEDDCNLDDLKSSLFETVISQKKFSYIQKLHASAAVELAHTQLSSRRQSHLSRPIQDADTEIFSRSIANASLKMLKPAAGPYIRTGHISDQNAIVAPQFNQNILGDNPRINHEVLITLTTYTRNRWYPYGFSRASQHILPSSSTLADVWNCIPCDLKGDGRIPTEIIESEPLDPSLEPHPGMPMKSRVVGYSEGLGEDSEPDYMVMVIENKAYCDGRGSPDYADKLFSHLQASIRAQPTDSDIDQQLLLAPYERPKRTARLHKGSPIHETTLRSLSMRINEPYWILHRGDCEHWFVIDEIRRDISSFGTARFADTQAYRLQNPRDPSYGYPIAIQRTPTVRPLCRICSKVPATLSILNDIRLGESPCIVCKMCWELFGGPPPLKEDDDLDDRVVVVPMPFP
ncbi:snRNA-activating protein of 50kDa MW C terminal-domain-containing protein [Hysterangium stoloniferum]|nr:snRNA-activating protein of 50kDa MW C terminal-domain-containing protein [Hysterangium stoloniferum]